ncbi:MAG: DUF4249 family protein [Bacteroidota bacterium]|nr:DUF4249 family protein [Bacteroidota bacterium]
MARNLILSILVISGLMWIISCRKSVSEDFSNQPVVESYLLPGEKVTVKISAESPYEVNATSEKDINKLQVKIRYLGVWYSLIPMGDGVYKDTTGIIKIIPDSTYKLLFSYNNITISSSTIIPGKPTSVTQSVTQVKIKQFDPDNPSWTQPPDPIKITFSNGDESYYFLTVECMDSIKVPIFKDSIPDNDILSSQPMIGTEIYIQPMSIRYFGKNRIVLYHINPEYSTFFMQQNSTSQDYQEPPTNVVNGLGIFTGINTDTLYLSVVRKY